MVTDLRTMLTIDPQYVVTRRGEPIGLIWFEYGLKRYCHRCGTDVHWWFQKARCRHYRRWHIKGGFDDRLRGCDAQAAQSTGEVGRPVPRLVG